MSTRLDLVLQKHPEHEEEIRLLASRDPSGNLKYLDWGAKILASGQALAPEIADVVELFHQFKGQRHGNPTRGTLRHSGHQRVCPDIYEYKPQHLAQLRDLLLKMKRAQDSKRRNRAKLYRIEGSVEADVVYDSPDLIVRHIKNKNASVHYGLGTKWCISMLRAGYFEDYEAQNATFFFFERKTPKGDEFDKAALMLPRNSDNEREQFSEAFTALDRRVDMMMLAKVHGARIFDIFREVYERSERYPGSVMSCVYAGTATQEQLEVALASAVKGVETRSLLESICCNDAAPQAMLEEIASHAPELLISSWKRERHGTLHRRDRMVKELERAVMAAVAIHPNTSDGARAKCVSGLKRRRIKIDTIRRETVHNGRIGIVFDGPGGDRRRRHRWRRRPDTVKSLQRRAGVLDRLAARLRKKSETLQRKLAEKSAKRK
jgi:hypothetical protein